MRGALRGAGDEAWLAVRAADGSLPERRGVFAAAGPLAAARAPAGRCHRRPHVRAGVASGSPAGMKVAKTVRDMLLGSIRPNPSAGRARTRNVVRNGWARSGGAHPLLKLRRAV